MVASLTVISSSVGAKGGRNRPADVITVQRLLNSVPFAQGGPVPKLQVDGLCGIRTITAIQKFQTHHFGWQGRDGRVDPDGQTLRRLNGLADFTPFQLPPLTPSAVLLCPHGGSVVIIQNSPGNPVLTSLDRFQIVGCSFNPGGVGGGAFACFEVMWLGNSGAALDVSSLGLCLSAGRFPNGPVVIASPGTVF